MKKKITPAAILVTIFATAICVQGAPDESRFRQGPTHVNEESLHQGEKRPGRVLTQHDLKRLDKMEKQWASRLDMAGKSIARGDDLSAKNYIDKAMETVEDMKRVLKVRGFELTKVPRLAAMEKLTLTYANLNKISSLSRNSSNTIMMNRDRLARLTVQSYDYLKEAEAVFRAERAPGLADACIKLRMELGAAIKKIEKQIGTRIL